MTFRNMTMTLVAAMAVVTTATMCRADELRNIKRGEPIPAFRLPTINGAVVDSADLKGKVVVVVCLSAEQRRSELAAMESSTVLEEIGSDQTRLVHVTADVIQKPYYEKFRSERKITSPLGFDADRSFFGKLGLIVYPTTIIIDTDGSLAHVISLHNSRYKQSLDAYTRHVLGEIDDAELDARLKQRSAAESTPKSLASAHRALARSMREKGLYDAAKAELLKAREQDADNTEIMLDLADLDLSMRQLDEAESMVDTVLEAQPAHRRARQLKGIVLFYRGDLAAAQVELEQALKLNPDPERVHYYLGMICEANGQTEEAIGHYREALRRLLDEPEPAAQASPDE